VLKSLVFFISSLGIAVFYFWLYTSVFGLELPKTLLLKKTNAENFLIVQIEDPETIDHIEEIAAVDGVDVVFVGPADLSLNLGIAGQFEHPKMQEVYERVAAACKKYNKTAGLSCPLDRIPHFQEMGFRFFVGGADYVFLFNGYRELHKKLEGMGFQLKPEAKF
jgi:4-hydroxy-2-oxoheptanedioate aldolase